ncbi:unnamed protein product [Musa hybrid cultivar]
MASSLPGPAVIVPYRPIRRCIFPSLHFQPRTAKLGKEGTLLLENQITKLRIIGRSTLRQDCPYLNPVKSYVSSFFSYASTIQVILF